MTTVALAADRVAVTYAVGGGLFRPRQRLHALKGVSLEVRRGEVLGLVGESGCGKSTLARVLMGFELPTSGSVDLEGQPLAAMTRRVRARRLQQVFQDPQSSLNPRRSVASIVALPLRVHGLATRREAREQAGAMLAAVGLPARLHDSAPRALSGGQRQRVAIARALILRPDVLICDEPTSALDVSVQAQILNLLNDLRESMNLTCLLISHNLAVVERMADRIAVMYLGRIVEHGETAQVIGQPQHPYTRMLMASVLTTEPGLGLPPAPAEEATIDQFAPPSGCAFHPRCPAAVARCRLEAPELRPGVAGSRVECHLAPAP